MSLPVFKSGGTPKGGYFFLAAVACFFFEAAALDLVCFCVDFFFVAFGDLSPMMVCFLLRLTRRRHVRFAASAAIMRDEAAAVNDRHSPADTCQT